MKPKEHDMDCKWLLLSTSGRLNRKPHNLAVLAIFLLNLISTSIDDSMAASDALDVGIASLIVFIVTIWPSLAIGVKRLHDLGRSGWWLLCLAIPFLNLIFTMYLIFFRGDIRENKFGPDPLRLEDSAPI